MLPTSRVEFVYLDTQAYDAASYNFAGTRFKALTKHLESGRLKLVITDITKAEVRHRIKVNLDKELASLKKFERGARLLRSANRIEGLGLFLNLDSDKVTQRMHDAFGTFLREHCSISIEATKHDAVPVFRRYFSQEAPFGPGEKRREFPDAFVLESLIGWAERHGTDLFVVSDDTPLGAASEASKRLRPVKNIALLLDHVASDDRALASFLRQEFKNHFDEIATKAATDFEDLGFHVVDEWGDVELDVIDKKPYGEPDLVDISGSQVTAEVQITVHYDAHLSYEDSNSGIYDKEEGRLLFANFVNETVSQPELLIVTVRATFKGIEPKAFRIRDIQLTDPTKGFGISPSGTSGYLRK